MALRRLPPLSTGCRRTCNHILALSVALELGFMTCSRIAYRAWNEAQYRYVLVHVDVHIVELARLVLLRVCRLFGTTAPLFLRDPCTGFRLTAKPFDPHRPRAHAFRVFRLQTPPLHPNRHQQFKTNSQSLSSAILLSIVSFLISSLASCHLIFVLLLEGVEKKHRGSTFKQQLHTKSATNTFSSSSKCRADVWGEIPPPQTQTHTHCQKLFMKLTTCSRLLVSLARRLTSTTLSLLLQCILDGRALTPQACVPSARMRKLSRRRQKRIQKTSKARRPYTQGELIFHGNK